MAPAGGSSPTFDRSSQQHLVQLTVLSFPALGHVKIPSFIISPLTNCCSPKVRVTNGGEDAEKGECLRILVRM